MSQDKDGDGFVVPTKAGEVIPDVLLDQNDNDKTIGSKIAASQNNNTNADDGNSVTYGDFVDCELIHFSNANNIRSLPNVVDGLKPSQRKVLYACFKRNLKDEIKV